MGLTVKDFAKTLKIKDDALLERMKAAGLSHSSALDEITPANKLAILKSLKERKSSGSSSVTSSSSSGGVTVKSKGTLSQPASSTLSSSEGLTDKKKAKFWGKTSLSPNLFANLIKAFGSSGKLA